MSEVILNNTDRTIMRAIENAYDDNANYALMSDDLCEVECVYSFEQIRAKTILLSKVSRAVQTNRGGFLNFDIIEENAQLRFENTYLLERIQAIEERLALLEANMPIERTVVLRNITEAEAKEEIIKLFASGRTLYYSDIAQELGISLKSTVEICNALQREGKIQIAD